MSQQRHGVRYLWKCAVCPDSYQYDENVFLGRGNPHEPEHELRSNGTRTEAREQSWYFHWPVGYEGLGQGGKRNHDLEGVEEFSLDVANGSRDDLMAHAISLLDANQRYRKGTFIYACVLHPIDSSNPLQKACSRPKYELFYFVLSIG